MRSTRNFQDTILEVKTTVLLLALAATAAGADIRIGIVGTDTSHVIAFTKLLNDPTSPDFVPGARVVAAYKGGSKDIESSYTRVEKYAEQLRKDWKVDLTPDIGSLCRKVDAVLLESVGTNANISIAPVISATEVSSRAARRLTVFQRLTR